MYSDLKNNQREFRVSGSAVSEGIAIGMAFFIQSSEEDTPDFPISLGEVDAEIARYRKALFSSKEDLDKLREDLANEGSEEAVTFIESHIQMLDDPMIKTHVEGKIRERLRNTESVFRSVIKDYRNRFCERDSFFQERLVDVMDVSNRILGHLREKQETELSSIPTGSVILAREIAPSYTAAAQPAQIGAFVTTLGGGNSHAALIARAKGIPYVANVPIETIEKMDVELLIIDGYEGLVIVNPSKETLALYRDKQKQLATRYQKYLEEDHLPAKTLDGTSISLFVNVGNAADLDPFPYKHDGIGLFRTEYLFLASKEFYPSESYQEEVYASMLDKVAPRPVVIRVFDLGGDKNPSLFLSRHREPNPVLGCRGIRFLLRNEQLFRSQLRAIHRVAKGRPVSLLLPLICDINELLTAKAVIESVRAQLAKEGVEVPALPVGCMIEVPSAVMICDALAKACDYLSLGTNDLVQYTLGVDRGNPSMRELYYPAHPSVLRMIKMIATEAQIARKPLTICGEIASNPLFTPLLLGLGLRQFSIAPRYLPLIKQALRKWTIEEAEQLADQALAMADPKEISDLMTRARKSI